ncbi:hypothetical protein ACIBBG_32165 [Micromonospora chersina]|uniref:hypothetical protein n=1 Tax=Micromonospora chersina TaxID=47854 RepID=UPI0037A29AA4
MQAASTPGERGAGATPAVHLRVQTFDERAEQLGATTETAKAELVSTDRKTLWRYRERRIAPTLDVAMRWADRLGLKVEELWERVA